MKELQSEKGIWKKHEGNTKENKGNGKGSKKELCRKYKGNTKKIRREYERKKW